MHFVLVFCFLHTHFLNVQLKIHTHSRHQDVISSKILRGERSSVRAPGGHLPEKTKSRWCVREKGKMPSERSGRRRSAGIRVAVNSFLVFRPRDGEGGKAGGRESDSPTFHNRKKGWKKRERKVNGMLALTDGGDDPHSAKGQVEGDKLSGNEGRSCHLRRMMRELNPLHLKKRWLVSIFFTHHL